MGGEEDSDLEGEVQREKMKLCSMEGKIVKNILLDLKIVWLIDYE